MPNPTFRRWTADDIAKLKSLAQKHRSADIAARLGRSPSATAVKAHQLGLSLKMQLTKTATSQVAPDDVIGDPAASQSDEYSPAAEQR
jgi:hypothetical protein